MSVKAVNEFLKRLDADAALLEEFIRTIPRDLANGAPVVAFAARCGFEFSEEDFCEVALVPSLDGELSDAELDSIVGGVGPAAGGGSVGRSASGLCTIGGRVCRFDPAGLSGVIGS